MMLITSVLCVYSCVDELRSGTEDIARATVCSLPSVPVPEQAEVVPEEVQEDPSPIETRTPHTSPDPSFGSEVCLTLDQYKYIGNMPRRIVCNVRMQSHAEVTMFVL